MYEDVKKELKKYANAERKKSNEWFFKTGKGEYGEGDIFLGLSMVDLRKIAKQFSDLDWKTLKKILHSKIHEERFLALIILVERYKKANLDLRKKILKFYLKNLDFVNNWDLVDGSAHQILGESIFNKIQDKNILIELAKSKKLWDRRVAIISTFAFIKKNKISDTLKLSKILLNDKEDLMHKAVGWMLREAWKKDSQKVEEFLIKNYKKIPRTTLRYSIEKMEEKKRKRFLKGEF